MTAKLLWPLAKLRWRHVLGCVLVASMSLVESTWAHPDHQAQIEDLDAQLHEHPTQAEELAKRGDLQRREENYQAAAADLAAARLAQPDYVLLDFYEGRLLLDTGNPQAAEQLFSRYLSHKPDHAFAWVLRARAWFGLGEPGKAAEDYARAVEGTENPDPSLYRNWALALVAVGEDSWAEARAVVDLALDRFTFDVALLALGTDIALARNLPDQATGYTSQLPPAIARLPVWYARQELLSCLKGVEGVERITECHEKAIGLLRRQM